MRCVLRIRYGKDIKEETHELAGTTPARAMKSAERLMLKMNEGLPTKKQGVLLAIRPLTS